jgi:type IV secretory pathway VirB2 component (pilin)
VSEIVLCRMRLATDFNPYAPILLLSTLILSGLDVLFGSPGWLKYLGVVCVVVGLGLIIWSASLVILRRPG